MYKINLLFLLSFGLLTGTSNQETIQAIDFKSDSEIIYFFVNIVEFWSIMVLLYFVFYLFLRKHKKIITVIYEMILLIMLHYIIIAQRDYIFEELSWRAYVWIILLLIGYFAFGRDLYSLVKTNNKTFKEK